MVHLVLLEPPPPSLLKFILYGLSFVFLPRFVSVLLISAVCFAFSIDPFSAPRGAHTNPVAKSQSEVEVKVEIGPSANTHLNK